MGRGIIASSRLKSQQIIYDYVTTDLIYYIDATKTESYSGTGTVINDLSGNNRTTRLFNGSFIPEKAFSFDSPGEYFDSFLLTVTQGGYSFESYLKVTSLNTFGNPGFYRGFTEFFLTTGGMNGFWIMTNGSAFLRNTTQASFPVNVYFHVVLTIDNNNITIYLNGSILYQTVNTTIAASRPFVPSFSFNKFNMQSGPAENIFADYKNILFYDRGLSSSEVLQNYNHFQNLYNF